MSDSLTITVVDSPRGFYVTAEATNERMHDLQRTPFGPLTGSEVLQLVADLPVRFVVTREQHRLF